MAASSLLQFGHYNTGFKGRLKDLAGLTEAADKGIAMHGGIPPPLTTSRCCSPAAISIQLMFVCFPNKNCSLDAGGRHSSLLERLPIRLGLSPSFLGNS